MIITTSLNYANGDLHLGHLVEEVRADIFARYKRLIGDPVTFLSGADMHGTPIMVKALQEGVDPTEYTLRYMASHKKTFGRYHISHDVFGHTHTEANRALVENVFNTCKQKGYIYTKTIEQLYDATAGQFLPDRFVKGDCPNCGAVDQYGDCCESCGSHYDAMDLNNVRSVLSDSTPIVKETVHYYFKLSSFQTELKTWVDRHDTMQDTVKHWLNDWLTKGLDDWCISRDAPYYGFEIPGSTQECGAPKFFYVWLDAPLAYLSILTDQQVSVHWEHVQQFIGKDIVYFHFLFWPALLMAMDIPRTNIMVNGFLTVDGKKMSKSRGTFIKADDFVYNAESLRFYLANKYSTGIVDIDFSYTEFRDVTNNVLLANLGNFCYRTLSFAHKKYDVIGEPANGPLEQEMEQKWHDLLPRILDSYNSIDVKEALHSILHLSALGNQYFQQCEPWVDSESKRGQVSFAVNWAHRLSVLVSPVLPVFASKVLAACSLDHTLDNLSLDHNVVVGPILCPTMLVDRVDLPDLIPLDIRTGEIVKVDLHPAADKLYVFTVNFGEFTRTIVAGLKEHFSVDDLVGTTSLFIINLEPAKLRGVMSEGMTLCVETDTVHLCKSTDPVGTKHGDNVNRETISFKQFLKHKLRVENQQVYCDETRLCSTTSPDGTVR
jgi:methionyl-tRNA synthetase